VNLGGIEVVLLIVGLLGLRKLVGVGLVGRIGMVEWVLVGLLGIRGMR
jgi:hypothetical protein